MLNAVLPTGTQDTFILSLGHSWTALHSHKYRLYAPNKTYEESIACYHLLSSFTESVMMTVIVSKVGVVPCRASSEKSMDSTGGISYYLNEC